MDKNEDTLDQESLLAQESFQGKILYSYHSLIHDMPKIDVLRESTLFHRDRWVEVKEEQIYSENINKRISGALFSVRDFTRLFGEKAGKVYDMVKREGYIEPYHGKIRVRSRFRVTSIDEFSLSEAPGWAKTVYQALQSLLIQKYSLEEDSPSEIVDLLFSPRIRKLPPLRNSSLDYLFRMGNSLISVDFTQPPSSEMLELVKLRLEKIYEDNMVNFFQIVSSYSAEETIWRERRDKREIFFDVVSSLLGNTWKLFDLEECWVRISGGAQLYQVFNGTLHYKVDPDGTATTQLVDDKLFPGKIEFPLKEYMMKSMPVVLNREFTEPVSMDFYMKSRSYHNINPLNNHLHHRFILLLLENMGKIMEQAIPVLKSEEMAKHLKWKSFLDRSRIRAMGWGEDLYRIMVDSVGILSVFLELQQVAFYITSPELHKMLQIFEANNPKVKKNFILLERFPEEEQIIRENIVPVRLLDVIGEEITLLIYLPLDPDIKRLERKDYLEGSQLMPMLEKASSALNMPFLRERIFTQVMTCLNSNPMLTVANIVNKWPREDTTQPGWKHQVTQFASELVEAASHFFDIIQFMDNNIEAGITNMRGSRDRLTGLFNRQKFNQLLDQFYLEESQFGLMFIDMDTFKIYNDAISHSFGDQLLVGIAARMVEAAGELPGQSVPGRFGGDEFCFALSGMAQKAFEEASCDIFRKITEVPVSVYIFFGEQKQGREWEVNAISFLHRLLRPDVGGVRGAASEFVEPKDASSRERLLRIYGYYTHDEGADGNQWVESLLAKSSLDPQDIEKISDFLVEIIIEKIDRNRMFSGTYGAFKESSALFIRGQLQDKNTDEIREEILDFLGADYLTLDMNYKISAGLAHTDEYRLRSVSSLFKAADGRAYVAKHNGRNCLFGLDNQRLL